MRLAATLQEGIEEAGVNIGRANYEFEGWYETEKGGVQFDPAAPLLEPKEIYAHWKPIEHTLRFDYNYPGPNPQDEPAVVEIPGNCETPLALTQMNTPEYPHYTFKGWCTAEGGEYNPPETVEETRTVYARWEGKQYSVIFDAGDGVSPQEQTEQTVTVTYPAKAAAAYPPAKANHGFTGWYTLPDGGEPFTPYTPPDNNAKFYAHWEEGLATLTLNYNHDAKAELKSSLLNGTLNFIEKPSRDYYTFAGWYDYPVDGNKYSDENGVVSIENYTGTPAVLYAHWTGKPYKLTLNYNGGADKIDSVYPDRITLQTPVRTGHTFEGWYTNANAGLSGDKAGDMLNAYAGSPANLYAKWKINTYTVTYYRNFDGNDNNVVSTTTNVPHGSTIQMPPINVPRPGYVAKGWYQARSGGGKLFGYQPITANTSFCIQWLDVNGPIPPNASGGETQYVSNSADGFDEVHIFKSSGTLQVFTVPEDSKVSILLVAGGGGGSFTDNSIMGIIIGLGSGRASYSGKDGGAGGVLMYTDKSLAAMDYTVTVGGGGGGGSGGGGKDGGDNYYSGIGGALVRQGRSGGSYGTSSSLGTAGGGGYISVGTAITGNNAYGAAGGKGITTGNDSDLANKNATLQSIMGGLKGVPVIYAVGGIGGGDSAGAANTGNGGAGGISSTNGAGFAGGSGIVVVRFPYQYAGSTLRVEPYAGVSPRGCLRR